MADINQVITLGIGTPSDIEHFILLGLNGVQHTTAPDCRTMTPATESREYDVPAEDRTITVEC